MITQARHKLTMGVEVARYSVHALVLQLERGVFFEERAPFCLIVVRHTCECT